MHEFLTTFFAEFSQNVIDEIVLQADSDLENPVHDELKKLLKTSYTKEIRIQELKKLMCRAGERKLVIKLFFGINFCELWKIYFLSPPILLRKIRQTAFYS